MHRKRNASGQLSFIMATALPLLSLPKRSGHCRLVRRYTIKYFSAREIQITTDAPSAGHSVGQLFTSDSEKDYGRNSVKILMYLFFIILISSLLNLHISAARKLCSCI